MATKTSTEANGCTFQWKIGNISLCLLKKREKIVSPSFIADALEGSKWSLWLYPNGVSSENYVDMYLLRCKDSSGPDEIDINYHISLLDKDGKCLTERTTVDSNMGKDYVSIYKNFARENIFKTEREAFLPEDTLTVQCTLWKRGETLFKSKLISALTVFKVNRRSFVWKIDEFRSLKLGLRNKFKDDLINFDIVLSEGLDFEKMLVLEDVSLDESIKYFSFKTSIIDSEGKKEDCGRHEYFADDLKKGVSCTIIFTKKLTESKGRYLQNDVLWLNCEYVCATGTVLYQFCSCGTISPNVTKFGVEENVKHFVEPKDLQLTPLLSNDLKSMYVDGIFSDTNLRTPTKTFPAHKNILGARSPVFRRMFSNDMKEKNSGYVDITDLEDDTVHRMLLYIYTDSLADLQLENACKLYAASEKYEIISLRNRCSSFLKDNLCSTKACDILVLADLHQDDDLKSAVQDFILRHDQEIFGSQEWKELMATNLPLAADVMYRKVFPG